MTSSAKSSAKTTASSSTKSSPATTEARLTAVFSFLKGKPGGRAYWSKHGTESSRGEFISTMARRLTGELRDRLRVLHGRQVADVYTASWDDNRCGVPREEVRAGLRGAQVEIASPSGLRPRGRSAETHMPAGHAWRRRWKQTFLSCEHFYVALTARYPQCQTHPGISFPYANRVSRRAGVHNRKSQHWRSTSK
jgi:hypothetical protein